MAAFGAALLMISALRACVAQTCSGDTDICIPRVMTCGDLCSSSGGSQSNGNTDDSPNVVVDENGTSTTEPSVSTASSRHDLYLGAMTLMGMRRFQFSAPVLAAFLSLGHAAAQSMTCGDIKGLYQSNTCCDATASKTIESGMSGLTDPPIPGVMAKHIILGNAPNYAPYTQFTTTEPAEIGGFMKDFADLMLPQCGIKVTMMLDTWDQCWTTKPAHVKYTQISEYIGKGIMEGKIHGCTAYTHTKGERELSLEFTQSILNEKKTAGILTRLDGSGKPVVSPTLTDYTGVKLGDVTGWAPTADTFKYTKNRCAGGVPFTKTDAIITSLADGNEAAITALKDGTIDALYIYADQIDNFVKSTSSVDNGLANGFGTDFAYIHQGLDGWSNNGTTLAISKKGSGLASVLNPCIEKVVLSQEYTTICASYPTLSCIQNSFSAGAAASFHFDDPMDGRSDSKTCSDGYCTCAEVSA